MHKDPFGCDVAGPAEGDGLCRDGGSASSGARGLGTGRSQFGRHSGFRTAWWAGEVALTAEIWGRFGLCVDLGRARGRETEGKPALPHQS